MPAPDLTDAERAAAIDVCERAAAACVTAGRHVPFSAVGADMSGLHWNAWLHACELHGYRGNDIDPEDDGRDYLAAARLLRDGWRPKQFDAPTDDE